MITQNQDRFTVLFVDDEAAVLSALRRLFRHTPYEIVTAADGAAALGILQQKHVDAALVDLRIPGMGGMRLLAEIREAWPTVQVVMLTGQGGVSEAVQAVKQGAVDFLLKPYEPDSLLLRIHQLYHIWRLEQENRLLREQVHRRAVAMGQHEEIPPADLPENLGGITPAPCISPRADNDSLESYELNAIRNALAKCDGHRKKAAQLLGIGEATLYRKLNKYHTFFHGRGAEGAIR
jgi:DNA-binding NtrC family response regulator